MRCRLQRRVGLHPPLLAHMPLNTHPLDPQGQWDAECGVGSNDAWIFNMDWHGKDDFVKVPRR